MAHASNPGTLGGRGGWITRSTDRDHPGQHGENRIATKIQKLAGHVGGCLLSQLLARLRWENCLNLGGGGCSELRSHHCTPAGTTRVKLHLKKNFLCCNFYWNFWREQKECLFPSATFMWKSIISSCSIE